MKGGQGGGKLSSPAVRTPAPPSREEAEAKFGPDGTKPPHPATNRVANMQIAINECPSLALLAILQSAVKDWPTAEYDAVMELMDARELQLKKPAPVVNAPPVVAPGMNPPAWFLGANGAPLCFTHRIGLRFHTEGKFGPWWGCPTRVDDGWCKSTAKPDQVKAAQG